MKNVQHREKVFLHLYLVVKKCFYLKIGQPVHIDLGTFQVNLRPMRGPNDKCSGPTSPVPQLQQRGGKCVSPTAAIFSQQALAQGQGQGQASRPSSTTLQVSGASEVSGSCSPDKVVAGHERNGEEEA
jgi:hypothetical protein